MYIAFKWLFSLASIMWIAICCLDFYLKALDKNTKDFTDIKIFSSTYPKAPITTINYNLMKEHNYSRNYVYHYIMFISGALLVFLYNKKTQLLRLMRKLYELNNLSIESSHLRYFVNIQADRMFIVILKYMSLMWKIISKMILKLQYHYLNKKIELKLNEANVLLLKRFIELKEERKSLGNLLLATIRENKNIKMRFQLESLAKNRLARYVEHTQRLIKENRCRYVSFQQLYLATHQENVFLKERISKLTREKDNVERDLITLINQVFRSQHDGLKTFCSKFIVKTKNNLLNSDVRKEIRCFLNKRSENCLSHYNASDSNCLIIPDAPTLRGLPGEGVWTVKDKDGLIKKLYEYNFHADYDNGDTISRIRQYSVYYDKDCLLDTSSSASLINQIKVSSSSLAITKRIIYPITSQRFLTGSPAFQNFLKQSNNEIIHSPLHRSSVIPCG